MELIDLVITSHIRTFKSPFKSIYTELESDCGNVFFHDKKDNNLVRKTCLSNSIFRIPFKIRPWTQTQFVSTFQEINPSSSSLSLHNTVTFSPWAADFRKSYKQPTKVGVTEPNKTS